MLKWKLLACNASNGKLLWILPLEGWCDYALADGNLLFCEFAEGKLAAFDFQLKQPIWMFELPPIDKAEGGVYDAKISIKPMLYNNKLIVGTSSGKILSIDPKTGRLYWEYLSSNNNSCKISGLYSDSNKIFFANKSGIVAALNVYSGKPLWQIKIEDEIYNLSGDNHDSIYLSTTKAKLYSININNGEIKWKYLLAPSDMDHYPSIYIKHNKILLSMSNFIFTFNNSGQKILEFSIPEAKHIGIHDINNYDEIILSSGTAIYRFSISEVSNDNSSIKKN